jgi:hypothetical protein
MGEESFNNVIYTKSLSNQIIFFICHKDRLPILQRYTANEKRVRNERYETMIQFVKRRDLNTEFIKEYRRKCAEEWRFVNNDSVSSNEEVSFIDVEEEKCQGDDSEFVLDIDRTQDLPLNDGDENIQETLNIN